MHSVGRRVLKGQGGGGGRVRVRVGGVSSEFMFNPPLFMFLGFYCYDSCGVEEEKNPL